VAGGIILQMDKAEPEDKVILGNEHERGIQPDMGGVHYTGITVDMQNRRRGYLPLWGIYGAILLP
jgi:hypothetical protein